MNTLPLFIFRVERLDGVGPWSGPNNDWSGGAGSGWCQNPHTLNYYLREKMERDRGNGFDHFRFGFMTFTQFLNYALYNPDKREDFERMMIMMDGNYKQGLAVYELNHKSVETMGDATQLIFIRDQSKRVAFLRWSTHREELNLLYEQSLGLEKLLKRW